MAVNRKFHLPLLLTISMLARLGLAAWLELGNDEVYYVTYALYPDWSYFDHPPMVGWLIRLFSLNLLFGGEWAIRLAAVVAGTLNTFLIYQTGRQLKNHEAGFYAAILYTTSVYCFVISGLFILPDTPQGTFWLLAIFAFLNSLTQNEINKNARIWLLMAGVFTGLALLSKYTSAFLWAGAGLYILIFDRRWLKTKELYLSALISALLFLPVIYWNLQNDWISFAFQGERVVPAQGLFRPELFATEAGGQLFYNNPVNVLLVFTAVAGFLRGRRYVGSQAGRLLLLISLPPVLVFLLASLFRPTLPHWSGPGYLGLILMGAAWLAWKREYTAAKGIPVVLKSALLLLGIILIAGVIQIQYGLFIKPVPEKGIFRGKNDFSLDMYGWKQLGEKFSAVKMRDESAGLIPINAPILSFRWFPAANLDYYVARPGNTHVLACGTFERIHHFAWMNNYRGNLITGDDAWYLVSGRDYKKPEEICEGDWTEIIPADTIPIIRSRDTVMFFMVYRMKGYQGSGVLTRDKTN